MCNILVLIVSLSLVIAAASAAEPAVPLTIESRSTVFNYPHTDPYDPSNRYGFNHAPSVARMPDGRLLCAWFSGPCEAAATQVILASFSEDNGENWGKAFVLQDEPRTSDFDPAFIVDGDRVWFFYIYGRWNRYPFMQPEADGDPVIGKESYHLYARYSDDSGRTWSPQRMVHQTAGCRSNGIKLSTGELLLPVHDLVDRSESGVLGVLFLLALVGLSLRAWYHYIPDADLPEKADKVFPYFISKELPIGIGGLLLAAILAATVSSITSGINTLAATITFDYRTRMGRELPPQQQLRFGRICSFTIGIAATLIAGVVHKLGNIFEITQTLLGLFCGPLCAVVIFAIVGKPMNRWVVISALIFGTAAGAVVAFSPIYALWIAPVSFFGAILWGIVGNYCVSGNQNRA